MSLDLLNPNFICANAIAVAQLLLRHHQNYADALMPLHHSSASQHHLLPSPTSTSVSPSPFAPKRIPYCWTVMFLPLYWVLPTVSALMWFSMLCGMLFTWVANGEPYLPSFNNNQTIAYISDIGAQRLKPLFIAGSVVTVVLLDLGLVAERWLRHRGRLAPNTSWAQKILSILSILASIAGALGLILLSIFDTYRHPDLHVRFLAVFIIGYVVSAILICAEYQRLGIKYRQHRVLRTSFWIKLFFIFIEIGLAIGFGVCNNKGISNPAAVLEWAVAFVFTFYVLSFALDLAPAVRSHHHYSEETVIETANLSAADANHANRSGLSSYDGQHEMPQSYGAQNIVAPSRNF